MDALKKALFEKTREKEQTYNDAVERWGAVELVENLKNCRH